MLCLQSEIQRRRFNSLQSNRSDRERDQNIASALTLPEEVKSLGFSWSEEVGPGTIIKASHVNEIKDNTDTVYSDLSLDYPGCTGAGWLSCQFL